MNFCSIDELMQEGLRDHIFPGAVLLVGKGQGILFFEAYGMANLFSEKVMTSETVFDLASLTKPLATALATAKLVDREQIALDQPVVQWFPSLAGSDKSRITPRQLLCHQSGVPAHRPFYMMLKALSPEVRKAAVLRLIRSVPLEYPMGASTLYSDLGFMLLCRLVESVSGCPMDQYIKEEIYEPMGLSDLFFVDLVFGQKPMVPYAATELCPLRKRLLVGEVHDENAWFAGGIDGHAGLFGTAEAVFRLLRNLVAIQTGDAPTHLFSKQVLTEVFYGRKADPLPLGFDRPSAVHSSAGHYFSKDTIGHLGYTGCSFWLDLKKDITVILLTNRVHPFRWRTGLAQFRPRIHDRIMEHFEIVPD